MSILLFFSATLIILLLTSLIWLFLKFRQEREKTGQLLKSPEYWRVNTEQQLFNELQQQTAGIIKTEESSLHSADIDYQNKISQIIDRFRETLNQTLLQVDKELLQSVTQTQSQNTRFLTEQQKQIMDWQEAVETETKNKINGFLESFETNMAQFFTKAEEKSLESINLELKSARSLIDSYKSQQLEIVEENIVAVLERTLSIVLKQKLSLKDQLDLVYEALEKAKIEKFLV